MVRSSATSGGIARSDVLMVTSWHPGLTTPALRTAVHESVREQADESVRERVSEWAVKCEA
ncbi:hypothetical protein GCM10010498_36540 [Streptomyces cavourensis]|nr:hypothetical protein GCM10010498_36540 [Streptomyces cavourensis]